MGKRGVIRQLLVSWRRPSARPLPPSRHLVRAQPLEGRQMLSAAVAPIVDAVWDGHNVSVVKGEYIVEFKPGAAINKLARESSFKNVSQIGTSSFYSLSSVKSIDQMETWAAKRTASVVAMTPNVVTRVADLATPNDPYIGDQWQYNNTGQVVPDPAFDPSGQIGYFFGSKAGTPDADIDAAEAWTIVRGDPNADDTSKQIVVAVLDTGIDLTHPDLVNQIWHNPKEIPGNNFDDDGDGFVDDVNGWNFVGGNNDVTDDFGHGTHVSGIIGATGNNGVGVSGVIQNVKILPVKIGNFEGRLTTIDIINGIEYVTTLKNQGVNIVVANGSFGGTDFPFNRVENDAVSRMGQAGTLFTISAGNDATDLDPGQDFPGKFSLNQPNVITVAATDNQDQIAFFSNIGAASVNIAAPGLNILSTLPTYVVGTHLEDGTIVPSGTLGYGYDSGTSMAAPMVAGAIALMKAAKPDASMMELKNALLAGADRIPALDKPIDAGDPLVNTAGRLNVYKAILALLNQRTNVDTSTRGSWSGVYGKQGGIVYGETGATTYTNSFANLQATGASVQVINDTSTDPDATQQFFDKGSKIASQLTAAGPITLDLDISDGQSHRVSLYQAAFTKAAGKQSISLYDPDSNTLIATYSTGDLQTGEYDTFEVNPPSTLPAGTPYRLRIVITPAAGTRNAVLNGVFFDPATTNDAALVTATPVASITALTGGDWRRQYGSQGAKVFGSGSTLSAGLTVSGGTQVNNARLASNNAALVQTKATSDKQRVGGYVQTKSTMEIRLNLGDTAQKLTVYAADLEKLGRAERLDLYNDDTGALISTVDLTNFSAGKYVSWVVSGHVRIHVTKLAGPTAVIGGVFVDAAPGAPIEFVGLDTTSAGNWKTYYGADAAFVFGTPSAPARKSTYTADLNYGRSNPEAGTNVQSVTVKVANGTNLSPFTVTSTDARYPLVPSDTSRQHVANPKSTGTSMNLDIKFTDQRAHTVAIYMVDPDKGNTRAQRVDLQLINPQTGQGYTVASQYVTNFANGKYVVFNVHQTTNTTVSADVRVRITRVAGATAVANGVFIG